MPWPIDVIFWNETVVNYGGTMAYGEIAIVSQVEVNIINVDTIYPSNPIDVM